MSVIVKNLTYIYDEGMPFASKAIDDISFEIKDNDFVGLIGHTGFGKININTTFKWSIKTIFRRNNSKWF